MSSRLASVLARPRSIWAAVLVSVVFLAGFGMGRGTNRPTPELAVLLEAHDKIRELAYERPDEGAVAREAIRGMIRALDDPFAEYLPRSGAPHASDDISSRALGLDVAAARDAAGVSGRVLPSGFGYVSLKLFSPDSGALVASEVRRLHKLGVKGLVLDVRGNPGGLVEEALVVAGAFIGRKPVFLYKTAAGGEGERIGIGDAVPGMAVVVLVDGRSASAAELVAGAIQDQGRGLVVGQPTVGKASVQRVIELSDGSAIKFTTASYRTPDGRRIAGKGISPDVLVKDGPGDPQLERAQAILRASAGVET